MAKKKLSDNKNDFYRFYRWCDLCKDYFVVGEHDHKAHGETAQHSVHLTALRIGLALLYVCFIVLLAVVLATIGGR